MVEMLIEQMFVTCLFDVFDLLRGLHSRQFLFEM